MDFAVLLNQCFGTYHQVFLVSLVSRVVSSKVNAGSRTNDVSKRFPAKVSCYHMKIVFGWQAFHVTIYQQVVCCCARARFSLKSHNTWNYMNKKRIKKQFEEERTRNGLKNNKLVEKEKMGGKKQKKSKNDEDDYLADFLLDFVSCLFFFDSVFLCLFFVLLFGSTI